MSFKNEMEMSQHFSTFCSKVLDTLNIEVLKECKGLFGIPDYLFVEKKLDDLSYVIAFELKLRNWKRGLTQAFKYRCYSNQAFVVVDEAHMGSALRNVSIFNRYNIGLASFNTKDEFKIHFYPQQTIPFSGFLAKKVATKVTGNSRISHSNHSFDVNHKIQSELSETMLGFVCT